MAGEQTPGAPPGSDGAAVRLVGVTKTFGSVTAVDDLDLEIRDGEFFSMLGPSGSGKTTVLRMIAGFEAPTSGRVYLRGADVTRQPPFTRDVNTVFQDYALFPHMDVLTNVEYGLRVKKVSRGERRERALAALDTVRLTGYGDRRPTQLSGGQRQRVALARALVNRPSVLLLDEPLGALDLKLRREMQIELKQIQREVGITFCFVTHDQEEALTMSDRIAVFNDGRVEQVATPTSLYEAPQSSFVAGFVGTSNLLTGADARAVFGRDGTFSIRPEKVSLAAASEARAHGVGQDRSSSPATELARSPEGVSRLGEVKATGTVVAIVYLGSVNHYLVELDGGSTLTVLRQNLHGTADQALGRRGERVDLTWADEHVIDLGTNAGAPVSGATAGEGSTP